MEDKLRGIASSDNTQRKAASVIEEDSQEKTRTRGGKIPTRKRGSIYRAIWQSSDKNTLNLRLLVYYILLEGCVMVASRSLILFAVLVNENQQTHSHQVMLTLLLYRSRLSLGFHPYNKIELLKLLNPLG